MLLHALKFMARTPVAIICSIVRNMPRSCSLSSNRDGMLLQPQGYGQRSFVKSIGGEESPATGDCIAVPTQYDFNRDESSTTSDYITLHDRYGLDSYVFCAVSSGVTNEHRRLLASCIFHAMLSGEIDTLHSMPHRYLVIAHSKQYKHHVSWYSIATYPLQLLV